jgi:hypothetical protein
MNRGTLNGVKTGLSSTTFGQCWTLVETGNWRTFRQDDTGDGTWELIQSRASNSVNEISDIAETAGASWITPAYSPAGNMTTMPQPLTPTTSYAGVYDAWNLLVKLASGDNTISEHRYHGANVELYRYVY